MYNQNMIEGRMIELISLRRASTKKQHTKMKMRGRNFEAPAI